jgi:hypothetical protein
MNLPITVFNLDTITSNHESASITLTKTVFGYWLMVRVLNSETLIEIDQTAILNLFNALKPKQ